MATHSNILAWRIPWTEEPRGLQPKGHKDSDLTEHAQYLIWRIVGECMESTASEIPFHINKLGTFFTF